MRNLKRALSLALASVMLLGMMVVGTSAAFSDADEIVNKEAVEITAGLGLFAGSDGKFNPKGTVTRAQMATVIAKMLYGSEINADQYKGVEKFSDTVAFEGGWAEGYINLCANLGIVGGYGDGTFGPGKAVTTAEAVTMIINALGVDAGKGEWPLTVMAKAEEMDLFEELEVKPGTNVALTRDQLASVVLEGIKYSPKGVTGYTIPGSSIVFEELGDAVIANGNSATGIKEVVGEDALYRSVFDVSALSGFVYANQATDKDAEYTLIGNKAFDIETGADLIGHYVTVYYKDEYKSEKEPGLTYCIVDESTVINVEKAIVGKRAEFRAAFGTRNIEQSHYVDPVYGLTYDVLVYDGTLKLTNDTNINTNYTYNYSTFDAAAGKYITYDNYIIAYVAPATVNATKVSKVTTTAGLETISIPGQTWQNNATDDEVAEYAGIAKDDIITYTLTGNIYHLAKATTVEGQVSTISQNSDNLRWGLTVNGTRYEYFGGNANTYTLAGEGISVLTSKPASFNFAQNYTLYLTEAGKLIGYAAAEGASANISDVIYVSNVYTTENTNAYGVATQYKYAQGVDMNGKEVNILVDVKPEQTKGNQDWKTVLAAGSTAEALANAVTANQFYTFAKTNDSKGAKEGIMTGTVAPASWSTVALDKNSNGITDVADSAPVFHLAGVKFGDSKDRLDAETKYLKSTSGNAYITSGTKFIMVAGSGSTQESTITVGSINYNLANANSFELLLTQDSSGNKIAEAVVIKVANITIDSDPVYVSANQVNFVNATADGYVFQVYDAKTGEVTELTLSGSSPLAVGFYNFDYDAEDKLHSLTGAADAGIVETNVTFVSYYNGMLTTTGSVIDNMAAKDAKVIDIRTQKQLDQSTIEQVTSIDDIVYLVAEEGKTITLDIIHDVKAENVIAIYVTSIS